MHTLTVAKVCVLDSVSGEQVEARLRQLEGKMLGSEAGTAKGKEQPAKYDKTKQAGAAIASVPKAYNADADAPAAAEKKVGGAERGGRLRVRVSTAWRTEPLDASTRLCAFRHLV